MSDYTNLKVVVLGDSAVGKTSLALRFVTGTFKLDTDSTVGASFITKTMTVGHQKLKFNIWDTAGQERYRAIVRMYYKEVNAALLVYDITKQDSFTNLARWHSELKKHVEDDVIVVVVANKDDLVGEEAISINEAKAFASRIGARYFRTSCKNDVGVTEMFSEVGQECFSRTPSASKLRQSVSLNEAEPKKKKSSCC
jgi:small GTP-binding protein